MGTRIAGNGREITVDGSLKDAGRLTITVDGVEYRVGPADGQYREGAASAKLECPNGLRVREGAASKDITLPDGTEIHIGAASAHATFPDGTRIENSPASGSGQQLHVQIKGDMIVAQSSSSRNNTFEISVGDTRVTSTQSDSAESESGQAEQSSETTGTSDDDIPDFVGQISMLGFVVALGAHFVFGIIGLLGAIFAALAFHMLLYTVAGIVVSAKKARETDDTDGKDADGPGDIEDRIEALSEEYASKDGEIDTIEEYEQALDDLLDDEDVDREDVEVERVTA